MNLLTKQKETHLRKQTNGGLGEGIVRLGYSCMHCLFKINNQRGPNI